MGNMLKVKAAKKYFKGQPLFEKFDLEIPRGEFHVLVGPSGCGKSTLFDGLTGVAALDGGTIQWGAGVLPDVGNHAAYMQQKDLLLPWFSLLDNAILPASAVGRNMDKAKARALKLFGRLGLEGSESKRPDQVSGGMRQRCALARTLMFDRELILLDEPLSALDAITRRGLQSLLLLLQSDFNKTILMITHDIEEALLLADTLYLLSSRPMTIVRKYRLSHPKPRRFDDPELLAVRKELLATLEGDLVHETA